MAAMSCMGSRTLAAQVTKDGLPGLPAVAGMQHDKFPGCEGDVVFKLHVLSQAV
jgi:hypothetical protein